MSKTAFATAISDLRKAHNYTQEFVSQKLHIARQTYSLYETGKRVPDLEISNRIAQLYSVSIDDLISPKGPTSFISENFNYSVNNPPILTRTELRLLEMYRSLPATFQRDVFDYVSLRKKRAILEEPNSK